MFVQTQVHENKPLQKLMMNNTFIHSNASYTKQTNKHFKKDVFSGEQIMCFLVYFT